MSLAGLYLWSTACTKTELLRLWKILIEESKDAVLLSEPLKTTKTLPTCNWRQNMPKNRLAGYFSLLPLEQIPGQHSWPFRASNEITVTSLHWLFQSNITRHSRLVLRLKVNEYFHSFICKLDGLGKKSIGKCSYKSISNKVSSFFISV